jgi:AhpD family alkylhydroperoxidase
VKDDKVLDEKRLHKIVEKLLEKDPKKAAEKVLEMIKKRYGTIPFIYQIMARRPDILLSNIEQTKVIGEPKYITPKIAELAAISAAAALKCDHCIRLHIDQALKKGSTIDEIFEIIMIAGHISKAAALAVSFRELNKIL